MSLANAYALAESIASKEDGWIVFSRVKALTKELEKFIDYTKWAERSQIYQDISYSQLVSSLEGIKRQIPNRKEATEVHKAFVKKIIPNWLKAFHLTPEMVDLSKQELKALDNYFYANLLMLECKNAAVRVSRKTWSEIESRMLMPFREQT